MSILVVDDQPAFRSLLTILLEDAGYPVVCACHGRDALTYLRRCTTKPGLILLDWVMPVMNGRDFLREQQRDAALASIPVVVLTARTDLDPARDQLLVAACLAKPPDLEILLTTMKQHYAATLSPSPAG